MVQPGLVDVVCRSLTLQGGEVFLQSDGARVCAVCSALAGLLVAVSDVRMDLRRRPRRILPSICDPPTPPTTHTPYAATVEEVCRSMRECFWEDERVRDVCGIDEWMPENPLGVATEREKLTLGRGDPVYRTLLKRVEKEERP